MEAKRPDLPITTRVKQQDLYQFHNPKKTENKFRWVNFFITINPNKRYLDALSEECEKAKKDLSDAILEYFDKDKGPYYDHLSAKEKETKALSPLTKDKVDKLEVAACVEYGKFTHCVHAHMFFKTRTCVLLHMDYTALATWFSNRLGLPKGQRIHMRSSVSRVSTDNLEEYIMKNVGMSDDPELENPIDLTNELTVPPVPISVEEDVKRLSLSDTTDTNNDSNKKIKSD